MNPLIRRRVVLKAGLAAGVSLVHADFDID
jgi:hypothetical protein